MAKKDDISRSTLAVLLICALVISVAGTWIVMDSNPRVEYHGNDRATSWVGLSVDSNTPRAPVITDANGKVNLMVK